jgi:hypothetical protein
MSNLNQNQIRKAIDGLLSSLINKGCKIDDLVVDKDKIIIGIDSKEDEHDYTRS